MVVFAGQRTASGASLTGRKLLRPDDVQRPHAAAQRDELVEREDGGGHAEVDGEGGRLEDAVAAVKQRQHVDGVEETMTEPEGGEERGAHARLSEDEDDAEDDDEQQAGHA